MRGYLFKKGDRNCFTAIDSIPSCVNVHLWKCFSFCVKCDSWAFMSYKTTAIWPDFSFEWKGALCIHYIMFCVYVFLSYLFVCFVLVEDDVVCSSLSCLYMFSCQTSLSFSVWIFNLHILWIWLEKNNNPSCSFLVSMNCKFKKTPCNVLYLFL